MERKEKEKLLHQVSRLVEEKFFNPEFDVGKWRALVDARAPKILDGGGPREFEQQMHDLVSQIGSSHTAFYHRTWRPLPPRQSICATLQQCEAQDGLRWMLQDVQEGGPAHAAGLRPGELLVAVGAEEMRPPDRVLLRPGSTVNLLVRKPDGTQVPIALEIPVLKSKISQAGQGYPGTPGIHSAEQVAGWQLVTDAVHARGGVIFLQLWHVGRISHSSHQPDGGPPFAPSAIKAAGNAQTASWQSVPFETPRELDLAQIGHVIENYRDAAKNAIAAGFDGVELHAANGYLPDQFLRDGTNRRTDGYGGSIPNRARFLFEVVEAISGAVGSDRVGVRLSPFGTFNDMRDSDPLALFEDVIPRLDGLSLAYLHLIEARYDRGETVTLDSGVAPTATVFRPYFKGTLIDARRSILTIAPHSQPAARKAISTTHR